MNTTLIHESARMTRIKILLAVIFSLALIGLAIFYQQAQAQYSLIPFGGRIEAVNYCCNGIELIIGPPRGGDFLFSWNSILYAFYQIYRPGPWVLGDAEPGGACVHIAGGCETSHPTTGIIRQIGTSLE